MKSLLMPVIFFCLFFVQPLQAQSVFGLRVGGISSTLNPEKAFNLEQETELTRLSDLLSYQIGMGLSHRINPYFSVDTDLFFAKRGYRYSEFFNVGEADLKMVFNYLNMPLTFNYKPQGGKLALLLGLQGSYLLSHRFYADNALVDTDLGWKSFDLSLDLGFAFNLRDDLKFLLSYQLGLVPVNDFQYTDVNGVVVADPKIKSRAIQLVVYHYLVPKW